MQKQSVNKKQPLNTQELRQAFIDYFKNNSHKVVPAGPLVPPNDPTLLFTNAGMVQFKDIFLGVESRTYKRAVSAQCCIRAGGKHNDLENVGFTARHHTFFEMLGNFSFGDYFKREAINYAWDFLTNILQLPPKKLWVTVHEKDEEAANIWLNEVGVDPLLFSRCGDLDNFWSMGDTGPCGPCSEIFYDHGPEIPGGPPASVDAHGDRYVEIWNLVFMQFNRDQNGKLHPLPAPSVDTGMGLERVAAILQGVHNNYDIDIFKYIISSICQLLPDIDPKHASVRVIADHIRSTVFLIAEDVLPANEGRAYVLRRIIRRAIRHGHKLNLPSPFFYKLVKPLVDIMGAAYPQLTTNKMRIEKAILAEEEQFTRTLSIGLQLLKVEIDRLTKGKYKKKLPGDLAFKLYDTYGFPLDLTLDVASEYGFKVDEEGFNKCMQKQRNLSKATQQFKTDNVVISKDLKPSNFVGYERNSIQSKIIAIEHDKITVDKLTKGMIGGVVLLDTPFYAESGGQVGDRGFLENDNTIFKVEDTQRMGKVIIHKGVLVKGELLLGQDIKAKIDVKRRDAIRLNHTATHLMHRALKNIIGEHVQQKGSLVADSYARFDFSHNCPLSLEQISSIEKLVNQQILANTLVATEVMPIEQAKKSGAVALFGEKYSDKVRVLSIGDFSKELCGGTHVNRTGDIGICKIIAEYGVASGVRRIEFVTGTYALTWINQQLAILNELTNKLQTTSKHATEKLSQFLHINKQQEKKLADLDNKLNTSIDFLKGVEERVEVINNINFLSLKLENKSNKALRAIFDQLKAKLTNFVVVLYVIEHQKINAVVGICKNLVGKAPTALALVRLLCGRGGGRDDLAEGGGDAPKDLAARLLEIKELLNKA